MVSYKEDEGQRVLKLLYRNPDVPLAVDTETTGLKINGMRAIGLDHCIGVSIAGVVAGEAVAHYFAVNHESGENVSSKTVEMLEFVLTQGRPLIFANVQFDVLSVETISGLQIENMPLYDICTMAHLVNENTPVSKSLESLGTHYIGSGKIVDEFVEKEKKSGNKNITPEQMFSYAVMDAVVTWRVWDVLMNHPNWLELPEAIWEDKQKFLRVLISMRRNGVKIDQELAQAYIDRGEDEMKMLATALGYPAKPTKTNPDPLPVLGPKALHELFIERLGLPVVKTSKKTGKPSFDKEAMEIYDSLLEKSDSPEARLVNEYRGWQKAVSSAYRPYIELLHPDGRLRASYKTHGTVTGRLSCSEPNLQQIPKSSDKPWNGKVKECFIAEEGYTLINADFSQLELRLGTAYAGEESLKQVFLEGRDIFTEMSQRLGQKRQDTKTLVYSMQYGAGDKRIMNVFGVTRARARKIKQDYFNAYPSFKVLADRCTATVERTGKIKLWTGRYRRFEYKSDSYKAMNSVIQGGAADLMERCMIKVHSELESDDCRILIQVHDSLLFEIKDELVDIYMSKIHKIMEDVPAYVGHDDFQVRFAVEVDYWSDREKAKHEKAKEATPALAI